jgi:hypothetical protein
MTMSIASALAGLGGFKGSPALQGGQGDDSNDNRRAGD